MEMEVSGGGEKRKNRCFFFEIDDWYRRVDIVEMEVLGGGHLF